MQITQGQLNEFKKIYKNQFGTGLSDKEAMDLATNLLNVIQLVYKPIENKDQLRGAKSE